jgi:gold/copper resistance efflux pump
MSFSRYLIDRPILAVVLSLLTVIAGLLAMGRLPLAEYPEVAPPTVMVRANYPGADPEVIAQTVAAPLEEAITGLRGMLYTSSFASSDGGLKLNVTFEQGIDPTLAQIEVQNRVARAIPRLPEEVQRLGVVTQKTAPDMLMVIHLVSPNERYDDLHLYNFAKLQVKDELSRIEGVGDVVIWGAGEYSLRVWLDPDRMAARELTPSDIIAALRAQNVQVAAGMIGQSPQSASAFQLSVNTQGRLTSVEAFGQVIIKTGTRDELVHLSDVARIELGANDYSLRSLLNNQEAAGIQIVQSPEASALATAARVRAKMQQLQGNFPEGIEHHIAYDPTIFVRASIDNVMVTLIEALLLVIIVVLLFLQNWRAAIIPIAAVPVSLVGTFAFMHLLGFSLNTLSLFGLVLSIGIVVDDAIVVVENVERHIALGKSARAATYAAMQEVTGPIIAITSVLAAVFIPTAFLTGLTGQFYSQFALTIAISTAISAFNSLTLSPALAAILLPQTDATPDRLTRITDAALGWLFRPFNRLFTRMTFSYVSGMRRVIRLGGVTLALYGGLIGLTALGFQQIPTGFVPDQDKYYLIGIAQLPSGASLDRTEAVVKRMTDIALAQPGVESVVAFPGLSVNGFVPNPSTAVLFAMLDPFEERQGAGLSAGAIAGALNQGLGVIQEGFVAIFPPPPVPGLGALGGFRLQVQDRADQGYHALFDATQKLIAAAYADGRLAGVFSNYQANVPRIYVDVDREKARLQGVDFQSLHETLQVYLGSYYVNDFNLLGKTYQVNVQADAPYRMDADAIPRLYTRNQDGEMVSVASVATLRPDSGPDPAPRYNAFPTADINGGPAPGISSGEAIAIMEELAREHLPPGFSYEWTDLTFQQKLAGNTSLIVFPLAVLFAFLILAAQYNSLLLPLAVMASVPMVLLSALVGVWLTGGDNNIFTQIGFVVLVGLATKNAILIVEFARNREAEGVGTLAAVLEACHLRLRPILMTSLAFVMGAIPLVLAAGAGAEIRQAMGIAVFAGMLGVTLFGLFLTPFFYYLIRRGSGAVASHTTGELAHV